MEKDKSDDKPLLTLGEIAPDGDIILVIGASQARLCVHSCLLKTASRVFKAMFGPHFSEGQKTDPNDSKKEVLLPEDDVSAMMTICAVIHHRNDVIPEELTSTAILQISIVADKYDCIIALTHAIHHWLDHRGTMSIKELTTLMAAAYLFDNAQAFSKITFTMLMEHAASYLPFAQEPIDLGMPWEVFCESIYDQGYSLLLIYTIDMLEEKRSSINKQLDWILSIRYNYEDCSCGFSGKTTYSYLSLLDREKLLPSLYPTHRTIGDRIKTAEQMGLPSPVESNKDCENYRRHRESYSKEWTLKALQELKNGKGICIDCIFNSGGNDGATLCRIKH